MDWRFHNACRDKRQYFNHVDELLAIFDKHCLHLSAKIDRFTPKKKSGAGALLLAMELSWIPKTGGQFYQGRANKWYIMSIHGFS